MTLGIRQLVMFASKNKQVVQIRIQVYHGEAVLERWSLLAAKQRTNTIPFSSAKPPASKLDFRE